MIHSIILSLIIRCLCSKAISNKLPWISIPLDLTQDALGLLCVRQIVARSSWCMVSCLHKYTGIPFQRGITLIIHRFPTQGYKIVNYHWKQVLRSNWLCYLLLCSILCTALESEIFSNTVNGIKHPVLEKKEKEDFGLWLKPLKIIKMEETWSVALSLTGIPKIIETYGDHI